MKLRIVGLIANFVANGVLLYGTAGYVADGSRFGLVLAGSAVTLVSIALLSRPTASNGSSVEPQG